MRRSTSDRYQTLEIKEEVLDTEYRRIVNERMSETRRISVSIRNSTPRENAELARVDAFWRKHSRPIAWKKPSGENKTYKPMHGLTTQAGI